MADPLPALTTADLELLQTALDPRLDGFGDGGSCLDDARAFLERLGSDSCISESLQHWLASWQSAGGNRDTLRLMVSTLLAERAVAGPEVPGDGEATDAAG